jgi:hypothetical protein
MYAGYFAYSLYSQSWQKQSNAFWQSADKGLNLVSLTRVIEGAHPYIVEDVNKNLSIYFIGSPRAINFVSKSAIFSEGAAIIELSLINNSLIYRESTLLKAPLFKQNEEREWQHSVVLLNNLTLARFDFFGWESIQQVQQHDLQQDGQLRGEAPITAQWYNQHLMETIRLLPLSLRINYTVEGVEELSLPFKLPQQTQYALFRYIGEKA